MSAIELRGFLLVCLAVNYGILLVWFAAFVLAHDWIYALHGRWFKISREQFDVIHYAGMAFFKIGVLLLNLVPLLALWIAS
ncbi:MAG TPA: hypothetical protein PKJ77_09290 [Thermodesulfobacteriota bacterium]|nr:hypothetical protein [Thermodesulfobacteriota bacterium]HQN19067.1 hypothetical protein [Syntrophobacteraceae bacterium]